MHEAEGEGSREEPGTAATAAGLTAAAREQQTEEETEQAVDQEAHAEFGQLRMRAAPQPY